MKDAVKPRQETPMLIINDQIRIPLSELEWSYARSGGPGGQNVNKVSSKAILHWPLVNSSALPFAVLQRFRSQNHRRINVEGQLVLSSQRYRDQERNRQDCLEKLTELVLAAAFVPEKRVATKPTRGSQKRRLVDKKLNSARKSSRRVSSDD
jgi:ribosome-associated protein